MVTMARRIVNGEECDVHGRWRQLVTNRKNVRPGVTAAAKQRTNRRERREAVGAIGEGLEDQRCHCGADAIDATSEHWPYRRGYCGPCATVRCDAYPGSCETVVADWVVENGRLE